MGWTTQFIALLWLRKGHQSFAQACYLHSQSRYPLVHLGQEEQVRVKCLAQGHNTQAHMGSNSQPWDHESKSLLLTTSASLFLLSQASYQNTQWQIRGIEALHVFIAWFQTKDLNWWLVPWACRCVVYSICCITWFDTRAFVIYGTVMIGLDHKFSLTHWRSLPLSLYYKSHTRHLWDCGINLNPMQKYWIIPVHNQYMGH